MPLITRLMLQNFKKFPELDLRFLMTVTFWSGTMSPGKARFCWP
jgi:recombinational DNA repair ATPase RecF